MGIDAEENAAEWSQHVYEPCCCFNNELSSIASSMVWVAQHNRILIKDLHEGSMVLRSAEVIGYHLNMG